MMEMMGHGTLRIEVSTLMKLLLLFIGLVVYLFIGLSVMLDGDDDVMRYMCHEGDIDKKDENDNQQGVGER